MSKAHGQLISEINDWKAPLENIGSEPDPEKAEQMRTHIALFRDRVSKLDIPLDDIMALHNQLDASSERVDTLHRGYNKFDAGKDAFFRGINEAFQSSELEREMSLDASSYSSSDTRDLLKLEKHSKEWGNPEFINWLVEGYLKIQNKGNLAVMRGLSPIRLFSQGKPWEQLIMATKIACIIDLDWPERFKSALNLCLENTQSEGFRADIVMLIREIETIQQQLAEKNS